MFSWAPGKEFVPLAAQQPQPQFGSSDSFPSLGSKRNALPDAMRAPPGVLASPANVIAKPPGAFQVPTIPLTVDTASSKNDKGSESIFPKSSKDCKLPQTKEEAERQMVAMYMAAKAGPPVALKSPIRKKGKRETVALFGPDIAQAPVEDVSSAFTKKDEQGHGEAGAFEMPMEYVSDSLGAQALTEKQMKIAALKDKFNTSVARKGFLQTASAVRHSTFSAMNLELGGRPRKTMIGRRETLAELRESVISASGPAQKNAPAISPSAAAMKDGSKMVKVRGEASSPSASSGTRTPRDEVGSPASSGSGCTLEPSCASIDEFCLGGLQFSRTSLLQFRNPNTEVPQELQTLNVISKPVGFCNASEPVDRSLFGTGLNRNFAKDSPAQTHHWMPVPTISTSENAWKPGAPLSRVDRLTRELKSLMNKVCPENVVTIAGRIVNTAIGTVEELELLIKLIFDKALAEPHYCEAYADMIFVLKTSMPQFPSEKANKPVTFRAALISKCQNEFESLSSRLLVDAEEIANLDVDDVECLRKRKKDRVLANMKFIGQLFLREMLSAKIIGSVIEDLAQCKKVEEVPEEPMVECICELLTNIGYTLESSPIGASSLDVVCSHLADLKCRRVEASKCLFGKRIQFAIQDLLDVRAAGWTKKTFKASAKTKQEIRCQQEMDIAAQAQGLQVQDAEVKVAGAKPVWLNPGC